MSLPALAATLLLSLGVTATARAQEPSATPQPNPAALRAPSGTVFVDRPRADATTVWVRGDTYKASVDGDAFTYIPYLGGDAERNWPIRMELRSVRVGDASLSLAEPKVEMQERCVRVARKDVVETYDFAVDHVEQSFVIDRLPQRGALEVRMAVATDMQTAVDGNNLTFRCGRGEVGYRDMVVTDAKGRRLQLPIEYDGGAIRLAVPAAFVAVAALPLVVDPLLYTVTVAATTDMRMTPDVAWNEAAQEHLVVWQVPFSAVDWDVAAMRTDFWMNPIASFWVDYTGQDWHRPRVACKSYNGMFLVVAQVDDGYGPPYWIGGRRFEAIGATRQLYPQFDIDRAGVIGYVPGNKLHPDVGADPVQNSQVGVFTVVYEHEVAANDHDIHYRLVRTDGAILGSGPLVLNNGTYDDTMPAISKSCGFGAAPAYGVVWQQANGGGNSDIVAAVLDNYGGVARAPFYFDVSANIDTAPRVSSPAELPAGQTFLIVYQRNYDPFSNAGSLGVAAYTVSTLPFRTDLSNLIGQPAGTMQSEPVVDSDGLRFVVAHTETTSRSDTVVSTLAIDGTQLLVHESRAVLQNTGADAFTPAIASCFSGGNTASRSYGVVCGDSSVSVRGFVYNGLAPGPYWSVRGGGCGTSTLNYGGYPVFGHSVDLSVTSSDPYTGIVFGFPTPLAQFGNCTSCTLGVNGFTMPGSFSFVIPYVPALVNITLSAQGFSLGASGPCLNALSLTSVVDFSVR